MNSYEENGGANGNVSDDEFSDDEMWNNIDFGTFDLTEFTDQQRQDIVIDLTEVENTLNGPRSSRSTNDITITDDCANDSQIDVIQLSYVNHVIIFQHFAKALQKHLVLRKFVTHK